MDRESPDAPANDEHVDDVTTQVAVTWDELDNVQTTSSGPFESSSISDVKKEDQLDAKDEVHEENHCPRQDLDASKRTSEGATSSPAASRPVSSPRTKLRLPARHYSSERDPYPSLSAGRDDNATETLPVRHTPIDSLNLSMTTPFVPTGLNVIDLGGSERVGTYSLNPAAGDHHPPVTPEGSPEESFEDSSTSMEPSEAESNDKRRYKTKGDPNSEPVAPDQAYNKLCMFLTESKQLQQLRQCEEESRAESTEDDAVVESLQGSASGSIKVLTTNEDEAAFTHPQESMPAMFTAAAKASIAHAGDDEQGEAGGAPVGNQQSGADEDELERDALLLKSALPDNKKFRSFLDAVKAVAKEQHQAEGPQNGIKELGNRSRRASVSESPERPDSGRSSSSVAISRRAAAATKQPRSKSCSPTHVPRSELEEALETLTTANLRLEKENFHLRKKRICRDFKTLMDKLRKVLKNLKNLQKEKEKPKLRDLRRLRATGVRFTTQQPSSAVAPAAGTDPQHVAAPAAPATPTVTPTDDKEILDNENQKLCARSLATITDLVDNVSVLVEALKLSPTLWWDYNKTRMEKEVIEAEARKLERENKVLREDFRKAMETITAMRKQGYGGTMRGDATGDAQQQQANNKNATLKPRGPMTISQESGEHQGTTNDRDNVQQSSQVRMIIERFEFARAEESGAGGTVPVQEATSRTNDTNVDALDHQQATRDEIDLTTFAAGDGVSVETRTNEAS